MTARYELTLERAERAEALLKQYLDRPEPFDYAGVAATQMAPGQNLKQLQAQMAAEDDDDEDEEYEPKVHPLVERFNEIHGGGLSVPEMIRRSEELESKETE
jgi:hypothetical protein